MTSINTSAGTNPAERGGRPSPANMHTDGVDGAGTQVQPLNMHTDIALTKAGSTVTLVGTTDERGVVGVRLPVGVTRALKKRATAVQAAMVAPEGGASAQAGSAGIVYVVDDAASVTGTASSALVVAGSATVDGTATSIVLTISAHALTALRRQRDVL